MANDAYHNPWAAALPLSPSRNAFWETEVAQPAERLEYLLGGRTLSITGEAYDGFTRIWKGLLSCRKQLKDADVVMVLRSSGMPDEALGTAWHEASQAVLLETGPDRRGISHMEGTMEWRDFIILLDRCYRVHASDLESFLGLFPLPSAGTTAMWGKKNPFQLSPSTESASQRPSQGLARSLHSISTTNGSHDQALATSYLPSPPQSPEVSQSWTDKAVHLPPQYSGIGLGNGISSRSSQPPRPRASSYLEDLQELQIGTREDVLKEANMAYGPSSLSHSETEDNMKFSTLSSPSRIYEADNTPLLPSESRATAFKFSKTKSDPPVPLNHPFFEERPKHSAIEISQSPRTSSKMQENLEQPSKSARRGSLMEKKSNGTTSGPTSPVEPRSALPGILEMDAPQPTPETRLIVQSRLMEIEGSAVSPSSSRRMSLSRHKRNQSSSQFSFSSLAAGLETAAKDGSLRLVEGFFEFGADPNFSVTGSKPVRHRALDFAAISGHSIISDYIIRRGADGTAVNTALVHAVLAGQHEIATHLIVEHHADIDSGVFLHHANPDYGSYARTGLRAHMEYVTVLSAASEISDTDDRVRFVQLLLRRKCNFEAPSWKVYNLKEAIKPKGLTREEMEKGSHYGTTKIRQDGFGYSPLARFAPICVASVELLLQAGAEALATPSKPPQEVLDRFKSQGFSCKAFSIVQPISCITSEAWQLHSPECVETVELLVRHGSNLSCNEPNGYEEKHAWRTAAWGAFEEKWSPPTKPLTPVRRAAEGHSQEGVACLVRLGAQAERRYSKAS